MNRAAFYTRQIYAEERRALGAYEDLCRLRGMEELRLIGYAVWASAGAGSPPVIVAGSGIRQGVQLSYAQGHRIVLSRHQRTVAVLLHELAHVLQPRGYDHGPAFRRTYLRLLALFGAAL